MDPTAYAGALANAYRAALRAKGGTADAGGDTPFARALRAYSADLDPWGGPGSDAIAEDLSALLATPTSDADTGAMSAEEREFTTAEAALKAGQLATQGLLSMFPGGDDDDDQGWSGGGDDGLASLLDGFVRDLTTQISQVMA